MMSNVYIKYENHKQGLQPALNALFAKLPLFPHQTDSIVCCSFIAMVVQVLHILGLELKRPVSAEAELTDCLKDQYKTNKEQRYSSSKNTVPEMCMLCSL